MAKRYVYFVSVWYWSTGVHTGVHNMEIALEEPVTTIKQVSEMEEKARFIMKSDCKIINYQLLREEADSECTTTSVPEEKIEN